MTQENQQPASEPRICPLANGVCLKQACRFWDNVKVSQATVLGVAKIEETSMCRFDSLLIALQGVQSGIQALWVLLTENKRTKIVPPKMLFGNN